LVDTTTDFDRMLGIENSELQDKFIFGLVPPGLTATAEMVSASTVGGLIAVILGILFFLFRIKKQKETV
jgi:LPXTG-motif cell wall-anchored protein